jgi:hypothetical protein
MIRYVPIVTITIILLIIALRNGFPSGYRFRDGIIAGSRNQNQASTNCIDAKDNDIK